jgi:hypothetical protein
MICATARKRSDLTDCPAVHPPPVLSKPVMKGQNSIKWVITKGSSPYFVDLIKNKVPLVQGCNSVHCNMTWQWMYCKVFYNSVH